MKEYVANFQAFTGAPEEVARSYFDTGMDLETATAMFFEGMGADDGVGGIGGRGKIIHDILRGFEKDDGFLSTSGPKRLITDGIS